MVGRSYSLVVLRGQPRMLFNKIFPQLSGLPKISSLVNVSPCTSTVIPVLRYICMEKVELVLDVRSAALISNSLARMPHAKTARGRRS